MTTLFNEEYQKLLEQDYIDLTIGPKYLRVDMPWTFIAELDNFLEYHFPNDWFSFLIYPNVRLYIADRPNYRTNIMLCKLRYHTDSE